MPNNYVLIERIELNNTATSLTFDNIPQSGYTDLKLVISARFNTLGAVAVRFNGSTSGYSYRSIFGDGSSATSYNGSSQVYHQLQYAPGASQTANTFSNMEMYIPNYRSSNQKSVSIDSVSENNATTSYIVPMAGLWSGTAAISSINILGAGGETFQVGCTFSLYGLAQVGTTPAIAPKADGGNVIGTDGTYWYHAFLSNGTFTPQTGLSCDVLMVGGGGGGGSTVAGGGGAGGLLYTTAQSLTNATNYPVTIGAGGAGGTSDSNGVVGISSTFNSLTALGGGYGGGYGTVGNDGGPGGSGGGAGSAGTANKTGGAGTAGQGNAGGNVNFTFDGGGGGGGAGAAGATNSSGTAGVGGAGVNTYSSWATATGTGASGFYAGGGGGGANTSNAGAGGAGGGGAGGRQAAGNPATINTGGGGGGGGGNGSRVGAAGGSGIVIIRYLVA